MFGVPVNKGLSSLPNTKLTSWNCFSEPYNLCYRWENQSLYNTADWLTDRLQVFVPALNMFISGPISLLQKFSWTHIIMWEILCLCSRRPNLPMLKKKNIDICWFKACCVRVVQLICHQCKEPTEWWQWCAVYCSLENLRESSSVLKGHIDMFL